MHVHCNLIYLTMISLTKFANKKLVNKTEQKPELVSFTGGSSAAGSSLILEIRQVSRVGIAVGIAGYFPSLAGFGIRI